MIPVRLSVEGFSDDDTDSDDTQFQTAYQMDPYSPLRLPLTKRVILGLEIGVFVRHCPGRKSQVVIISLLCLGLADRIWEPLDRVHQAICAREDTPADSDILFVLLALLKSATDWWEIVLGSYSRELIEQVWVHHQNNRC
jgi:hypothetical protein